MPSPLLKPLKLPSWSKKLPRLRRGEKEVGPTLKAGIALLAKQLKGGSRPKLCLPEQPFDSLLLETSGLFGKSREAYLTQGGTFQSALLSSARSLSSPSLLEQNIQYSPVESELIWSATDPIESNSSKLSQLFETRAYTTSIFHEQSHRLLWHLLPPPPPLKRNDGAVFRYLNFVESLVISMDMALGDELGPRFSQILYLAGVTYDPGTDMREKPIKRRTYRNYLHACLYSTYLALQLYERSDIEKAVTQLYPVAALSPHLTKRAIDRACRLDEAFIRITNLDWQEKNEATVVKRLWRKNAPFLELSRDPLDHRLPYLWAEIWFEKMGI